MPEDPQKQKKMQELQAEQERLQAEQQKVNQEQGEQQPSLDEQLKQAQESEPQPRTEDPVETLKKEEEGSDEIGGDSSVDGGQPVKRQEQDAETVNVEQAPPSPSVR